MTSSETPSAESCTGGRRILLAFDFDQTMVDDNSDTSIKCLFASVNYPPHLNKLYDKYGWTIFMQAVFKHLHDENIKKEDILKCIRPMNLTPGMKELIHLMSKPFIDCIIISDSNAVFIGEYLEANGLGNVFTKVYTNPATFEGDLLKLEPYEQQTGCDLCAVNICKGSVLTQYVNEQQRDGVHYSHIGYLGDGRNDFCPSYCLKEHDAVFPRTGFALEKYIEKIRASKGLCLSASVHPWANAAEIVAKVLLPWIDEIECVADFDNISQESKRLNQLPKLKLETSKR
uniref:Phosphoethanolamine/phosphocholine phosphatase n=1 Tax=Hirondellea gigas TaxID=1518452 RepID=A0A2P2I3B9_9CRUS